MTTFSRRSTNERLGLSPATPCGGWGGCAEQFAVGLEDDHKLHRVWLITGLISEAALVGMLITSLQEPGPAARGVLAVVVAGLGLAMGVHLARFRIDGQPRT